MEDFVVIDIPGRYVKLADVKRIVNKLCTGLKVKLLVDDDCPMYPSLVGDRATIDTLRSRIRRSNIKTFDVNYPVHLTEDYERKKLYRAHSYK